MWNGYKLQQGARKYWSASFWRPKYFWLPDLQKYFDPSSYL